MASLKNSVDVDSDEEEVPDLQAQEASEAVVEAPVVTDLSNPEVVNKYQEAAKIAQLTLQNVILKVKNIICIIYISGKFFMILPITKLH
jgi:hypothetical protein